MRHTVCCAVCCLLLTLQASPLLGQATDSLHLEQVIGDVIRLNGQALGARFMEQAAKSRIGPAGAWDDPMLMIGVQNLPTNFDFQMDDMTMTMVGLSQRIPYSGYRGLNKRAAESDLKASTEDRRISELNLITEAKRAYYDLYYRQSSLRELKRQRDIQQQVIASSTAKLKVSLVGQEDVLAAQAELWRLESSIVSADQDVMASANRLFSLRGLDPPADVPHLIEPAVAALPDNPASWIEAAQQTFPPLQRLRKQSESYAFAARSANRMRWPMLDLSASYGFRSGSRVIADGMLEKRDNMISFGLSLSLPIFAGRQQGQMARSMYAMQESVDAEARQLGREVQSDLTTLHQRASSLQQSMSLYRDRIVPVTEEVFRTALAGYTNGATTFESLLMYASAVYRDRLTAIELANELAITLTEAEQYTTDARIWESLSQTKANDTSKHEE